MTEIKDPILAFLESVTYDEVMAYTYLLNMQARSILHNDTVAEEIQITADMLAGAHYGWDDTRKELLGKLCNWHMTGIPTRDWRINYFMSVGRGITKETLVEQYGDLKEQGDSYKRLIISALKYSNRMSELRIAMDAVTTLYGLVYLEDDELPVGDYGKDLPISAWANTDNWALQQIKHVVSQYMSVCYLFCLTSDVLEKCVTGACGRPRICAGVMYQLNDDTQVVGENGILLLDKNKPVTLTSIS